MELNSKQLQYQHEFNGFASEVVKPFVSEMDQEGRLKIQIIEAMSDKGYFGGFIADEYGGLSYDMVTSGLLAFEIGRYCSSVRNLLTVNSMVAYTLQRWGSEEQKSQWLPNIASGKTQVSFALTEPNSGSDVQRISTSLKLEGDEAIISGSKAWISFAEIADMMLVFAKLDEKIVTVLVPCNSAGLSVKPELNQLLGSRASMLATVDFNEVRVNANNIIGKSDFSQSAIWTAALDIGRYSVAWGSLGMAEECLRAALKHAKATRRFGQPLVDKGNVASQIAAMVSDIQSSKLLCLRAGILKDNGDMQTILATYLAKYAATKALSQASKSACQILGATGCIDSTLVARAYRDAKIMEIIEGSTELHERMITDLSLTNGT